MAGQNGVWERKIERRAKTAKYDGSSEWKTSRKYEAIEFASKEVRGTETSKQEGTSCPSQTKEKSITSSRIIRKSSTKDAKQSCVDLRNVGHFANEIYLVDSDPTEPKNIQAISCEFAAADKSKLWQL